MKPDAQLWWEVQQFMHYEADLLDQRLFDEWLTLLDEDITYRMPLARNVRRDALRNEYSGVHDAAWFDEGLPTLRQRVAQIKTGIHWAEEPASRISHLITNIRIVDGGSAQADGSDEADAPSAPVATADERITVRSRFLVYQNRLQSEENFFVGKRQDVLRREGASFKIVERTIFLDQNVLLAKALTTFF